MLRKGPSGEMTLKLRRQPCEELREEYSSGDEW